MRDGPRPLVGHDRLSRSCTAKVMGSRGSPSTSMATTCSFTSFPTKRSLTKNRSSIRSSRWALAGVYMMSHPKQSNTLVDPHNEDARAARPVRGEPAETPLVIWESGLAFRVRLGDGLKTGIFLDQRENRRSVRELRRGKRVLNLFAYTCGFTVAAAAGGRPARPASMLRGARSAGAPRTWSRTGSAARTHHGRSGRLSMAEARE